MRKRIVLVVVALAALAGGGGWAYPRQAQCAPEAPSECWGSAFCVRSCACQSPANCTAVAP